MIVNMCYNSTEPSVGLSLKMDSSTMKCYMADTGLLVSHAFDANELAREDIHRRILFDSLEIDMGMVTENVVAQMLTAAGHKLFFFSRWSNESADERMEIDFLVANSKVRRSKNVTPIEVKSGKRYTLKSLTKYREKYKAYLDTPIVLHAKDVEEKDGFLRLPIYMAGCL